MFMWSLGALYGYRHCFENGTSKDLQECILVRDCSTQGRSKFSDV